MSNLKVDHKRKRYVSFTKKLSLVRSRERKRSATGSVRVLPYPAKRTVPGLG
jgi:hypothetical protein